MRERLAAVLTVSLVAGALVAATGAPPDCVVFAVIGDNGTVIGRIRGRVRSTNAHVFDPTPSGVEEMEGDE